MLVVDDTRRTAHSGEMLTAEGIKVDEVSTAAEGLEACDASVRTSHPRRADARHGRLPARDGVRADRKSSARPADAESPATVRRRACRELGIRGYLTKRSHAAICWKHRDSARRIA